MNATWLNIAFSSSGLSKLVPQEPQLTDPSFITGLANQSPKLGDPNSGEGAATNWVVGSGDFAADILLIFAADGKDDLLQEIRRVEGTIYGEDTVPPFGGSGVRVIFKEFGDTLPPPLTGHEHFGFRDGISQPGVRGRLSDNPNDVFTPRQNPNDRNQGKPGQDLLWPGAFVFGYANQDPTNMDVPGPVSTGGPDWTKNGSLLVFRRLRQDVPGFRDFTQSTAASLSVETELLAAKFVGRWRSGAPLLRAATSDNTSLAASDCANNNFEFQSASAQLPTESTSSGPLDCSDGAGSAGLFEPSPGDSSGTICPFSAHIRKSYPRDDVAAQIAGGSPYVTPSLTPNEADTQTHRLMRRGIPYGTPYQDGEPAEAADRGLLFIAYQSSIGQQFEFVTQNWVNRTDFKDMGVGVDPILGQSGGDTRSRQTTLNINGVTQTVGIPNDFVIPTGGGYFFSPSIDALETTLCAVVNS